MSQYNARFLSIHRKICTFLVVLLMLFYIVSGGDVRNKRYSEEFLLTLVLCEFQTSLKNNIR